MDTIPEDVDRGKKDACIQAMLCNCDISGTKVVIETASKDACEQANLCSCSEFVGHAGGVSIAASRGLYSEDALGSAYPLSNTAKNSHLYVQASSVKNVSDVGTRDWHDTDVDSRLPSSEKMDDCSSKRGSSMVNPVLLQPSDANRSEMVRSSASLYSDSYTKTSCNASLDNSVGDELTDEVFKSESGGSQSDSVLVSIRDISLQTSVVESINNVDVGERPGYKKSAHNALLDNSDGEKLMEGVLKSKSGDSQSDSVLVTVCDISLQTSVVESVNNIDIGERPGYKKSARNALVDNSDGEKSTDGVLKSESGGSQSDSVLATVCDISLQTSFTENVSNVGVREAPGDGVDVKRPVRNAASAANQLSSQPPDSGRDEMVHSSTDMISESSKNGSHSMSCDNSVESVTVSMCNVSLQTSVVEKVRDTAVEQLEASAGGHLPSLDDTVLYSLSPSTYTAEVDRSSNNMITDGCKKSGCSMSFDTSVGDKLFDGVFEPGCAAVCAVPDVGSSEVLDLPKPLYPVVDDASDEEVAVQTRGKEANLMSDESDGDIVCRESPNARGGPSPAQKLVSDVPKPPSPPILNDTADREVDGHTHRNAADLPSNESDSEFICRESLNPQGDLSPAVQRLVSVGPKPPSLRVVNDEAEQRMDMRTHGNAADLLSSESDSDIVCRESINPRGDLSPATCKPVSDVSKPPFHPVLDDVADQKMDVNMRAAEPDLLSEESDGEIFYRDSASPRDHPSPAARKVLTSTTLDSPEAISDFFRLAGSSLSGSEKSPQYPVDSERSLTYLVDSTRRKSKRGRRRVSMCGEYDGGSPTEYFTPHRITATTKSMLTTVADTDEEDTVPSSKLFTTASEGHVQDTASESNEDCKLESLKSAAAVNGCIPDSPVEGSELLENGWSFDESLSSQDSECSEHISAEPTADGYSVDVHSEGNKVVRRISAVDDRNSASPAKGIEHLQTESAVLETSVANMQNTLREPVNGTPSDRNGAADSRNR